MGYKLDETKDFAQALADAQKIVNAITPTPPPAPAPSPDLVGAGAPATNGAPGG